MYLTKTFIIVCVCDVYSRGMHVECFGKMYESLGEKMQYQSNPPVNEAYKRQKCGVFEACIRYIEANLLDAYT